jgi:hypothetical protein
MAATLIFLASGACFCTRHWVVGTLFLVVAILIVL